VNDTTAPDDTAGTPPASRAGPVISCVGLGKVYVMGEQTVRALNDVTLDIARGEFVAIMGPSGSGKSTLLNLIGALDAPSSGKLLINGTNTAERTPDELARLRNREIGFVFQQFNLLSRTSALENVKLPLVYSDRRGADADGLARARLEEVGLGERLDHTPAQLSGGQQQRVAIARALVTDPRIILADEPTGALDTETSVEIMKLLKALNRKGLTVVLVTHEPDMAKFAGRRLTFRDGRLVGDTKTAEAMAG